MWASIRVLLLTAIAGASVAGGAPAPAAANELVGEVGPGPTIRVKDPNGDLVLVLDPGTYTITVRDLAEIHNFRLFGPGVNLSTSVERVETAVWTVTLTEGTYSYMCDPHSFVMRGSFRVRAAAPPPLLPPPAPAGTLVATVGPGAAALSLKFAAGGVVRSLPAGTYVLVVRDRSAKQSFRLVGRGLSRKTGTGFRGTVRWRVTFHQGVYRYWSSPAGVRRTLRVL